MENKKRISIVVPVYNEGNNIIDTYAEILKVYTGISPRYDLEIIFVNDGSVDDSWAIIQSLAQQDSRILGLCLSRNFGHQFALSAWYEHANGDLIASIDCDLQDPPALLVHMLTEIEKWADIVYARRTKRTDGFLKDTAANVYYKLLSNISQVHIPRNVGDFRLFNRQVLEVLIRCQEWNRYLRWLFAWFGFRTSFVDYERPERMHGKPWYTRRKSLKLAGDGILHFSTLPLKLWLILGIIAIICSSGFFVYIVHDYFINGVDYPLYKWINVILFGFMGLQFVFMWILWEYILRIHNETRGRPLYIIQEKIGK